jgi:hypothetical protein
MAIRRTTANRALPVFFDVSHRVGPNCPNHRDDVMLVQYLMKKTYQAGAPRRWQPVLPPGGVTVDGRFSYLDKYLILHYQLESAYSGRGGHIDGIISPSRGEFTTSHHVQYTIIYLNLGLQAFFPQIQDDPRSDPEFPRPLLGALARSATHDAMIDRILAGAAGR